MAVVGDLFNTMYSTIPTLIHRGTHDLLLTKTFDQFVQFSYRDWIATANQSIKKHNAFYVALSGGSTPLKIFEELVKHRDQLVDPSKIFLFWGDERCVPPSSPESNYGQAMQILNALAIPESNIFRMQAELENGADQYQQQILARVPHGSFDMIMLGMGADGHTLSLFPQTQALSETHLLVVKNHVPQSNSDRITFTLPLVKRAQRCVVYIQGKNKQHVLEEIFSSTSRDNCYPIEQVHQVLPYLLWVLAPDTYEANSFK